MTLTCPKDIQMFLLNTNQQNRGLENNFKTISYNNHFPKLFQVNSPQPPGGLISTSWELLVRQSDIARTEAMLIIVQNTTDGIKKFPKMNIHVPSYTVDTKLVR